MYPIIRFGSITIYSYGLLLGLAVVVGVGMGVLRARKFGIPPDRMRDLALYGVLAGLLGGRLLGFLLAYDPQRDVWLQLVRASRSAGAVQGGVIAGVAVGFFYLRRYHLPAWGVADAVAPGIAFAQAIGRVGCFLAGCCYGQPTDVPWAVTFSNPAARWLVGTPLGVPLHPTQLYEAGAITVFAVALLVMERKVRYFPGRLIWTYALLYSVARFIIEFYRHQAGSNLAGVSAGQLISLVVGGVSALMLVRLSQRSEAQRAELATPPAVS